MTRQRPLKIKFGILSASALFIAVLGFLTVFAASAIAQNPVPFIDQPLVPDATAPGGAGFTLTVNGAGFVATSVVNWNGSPRATTYFSSHQLTTAILTSDIATASTASVTVVNPSPGVGVSNAQFFSVAVPGTSVSFQPVELYDASEYIVYTSLAIADLTGDGKPDLVVASQNWSAPVMGVSTGDGAVEIFLGNGDGTFQAPVSYDSGGGSPSAVAVADVNGDGKPDIVVVNQGNDGGASGVGVLFGNGDGTFQGVRFTAAFGGQGVVAADVNGDGKLDVIVSSCCQGGISGGEAEVLLGNGDGTFQPAVFYSSGAGGEGAIAAADVNGDGKLDLVMTGPCPEAGFSCAGSPYPDDVVGVLLGNGNGTFQPPLVYDSGGYDAAAVAVADVNADGKPDLFVGNCQLKGGYGCLVATVAVFLGNGSGTFQPPVIYPAGNGDSSNVSSIAAADVNMDGKVDVVATTWYGSAVGVLLGNGDGTFQPFVSLNSGAGYPISVAVADVNGDGKPDAVAASWCVTGNGICSIGVLLNDSGSAQTPTATTLVSSLNPSGYGQALTFTAAVSSASGLPTGTVIFYDGSAAIGSATLANRSTSISVSTLAAGSQPITAVYQGCSAFGPSTSAALNQVVNRATTTTSLVSSGNPVPITQRVTYTATAAGQYGGAATGTVTFQDNGATAATVALSRNQAAHTTSYPTAGIHSITATYSGDANNGASISSVLMEEIGAPYKSTTAVTTSGSPSFVGQPVTFTASVTSIYGAIPNGETVTFYDDGTAIGTGTTTGGVAAFTTSSLAAKTHSIKATYAGDPTFKTSYGTVTQVVDKYTTTTALISSLNPSPYGKAVAFTASVASAGSNTPTGRVKFTGIGTAALSGGVATITTPRLNAAAYAITAEYEGDSNNATSDSSVLDQVVNPASTTTALKSSANPASQGQTVTFTAAVKSSTGAQPTGTVTFTAGTTTLGTVNLESAKATISTSTLPVGPSTITATYNGVTDFTGSSASLTQTVK